MVRLKQSRSGRFGHRVVHIVLVILNGLGLGERWLVECPRWVALNYA